MLKRIVRTLALVFFAGCSYLLMVYGKGAWQSAGIINGTIKPSSFADIPEFLNADAWVILAKGRSAGTDAFSAVELAYKAQQQDLVSGRPTSFLLENYIASGRLTEASSVAILVDKLWPIHIYSRSRLADYWLVQGRIDKYLDELGLLVIRDHSLREPLFSQISQLAVVEDPKLLRPFVVDPPAWWDAFVRYLQKTQDVGVLESVIERRLLTEVPLSKVERAVMGSKLRQAKRWSDAYIFWLNGLPDDRRRLLVNGVYDGSFEEAKFNHPYGWKTRKDKGLRITSQSTYGALGRKALQIEFRQSNRRIKFNHLSQRVMLDEGSYSLQLKYRLDTFKTSKGLVWRVRCVSQKNRILAESEALRGRQPWKTLSFGFSVPNSCPVQSISLEAASKYPHDHLFSGRVWFDDVRVIADAKELSSVE